LSSKRDYSDPPPYERTSESYDIDESIPNQQTEKEEEEEEVLSTLPTDFNEINELNRHFGKQHEQEVNNDTVEYTKEDQIDICVLERLASFCEETADEDALQASINYNNVMEVKNENVPENTAGLVSVMSSVDLNAAILENINTAEYYCSDNEAEEQEQDPHLLQEEGDEDDAAEVVQAIVSEDSDDEIYLEAVKATSEDGYDNNNIDK